jgi:hypothetical protein
MSATQLSWYGSSASPEWYTEAHVIERVVKVLGAIDLDPCSNPPPYNVPAVLHYTRDEGGLTPPWGAPDAPSRVYLNPPFGRGMHQWLSKLTDELNRGRVSEAITLTPARTDTAWFQVLWNADALCFWSTRLQYKGATERQHTVPFPSVLGYFGPRREVFADVFGDAGKVVYP